MKKKYKLLLITFILFSYYQLFYKRYFIYNDDKSKVFTIWKKTGHHFYLIPGKYYSPFLPKKNYIYAKNQGFNVVFNSNDSSYYNLGIYYKEKSIDLNPDIKVFKRTDSLLKYNGILKSISFNGRKNYIKNKDSLKNVLEYKYIDTKRIYGIKIIDY
ncbi:hypothetical protein [Aureivirga marina]|uniref:hypothetical protein n=1 Tax=Aureivirga marina TaxID=1182451 RepID=UPI0018C8E0BB|nr:hypothetical protein [Aureivirga marina]